MANLIEIHGLTAFYGDFQALFGIDIRLEAGETIAVIGANGAGKSTLMRSIAGVIAGRPEMILHRGEPIGQLAAPDVLRRGIALVPEGRKLFPSLTVEENLLIGSYGRKGRGPWTLESIYALFPILKERRKNPAPALSGGQQQMVAIGRALMSNPEILLCDELSLGLAPVVIKDIYAAFSKIRAAGAAIVVVEQDIAQTLKVADRLYCMMEGRITLTGRPADLDRSRIHDAYFGAKPHELP
ncbi:ATP-binding cassette domain-containing protein [Agrobacterium vitis]|uniref:ABC transporter ATP-binding protein n=1 Tax=Agrobacterium vitis TaxID=373 RepID=A0AAE4X113_AGRVI|nr:ABC transporter ATP-binding protein [Agrobacterium vitis]MBF2714112.1 ABC transporter ATP-binding protein [Agrobacterium vitis]MUO81491.1 ATP-binding cassette domain-containing protein [Agrobacterium vitis]MUO95862.1 ATP-binding cassette domain-containing protein [Agrobacterium vitis]MVA93941.1 ATP-binding cassette domain-containing protein [Agrobacterium vitis]MVB03552.1 ATP-binding cassette domain-containing protein [Agrobacterium vitis]